MVSTFHGLEVAKRGLFTQQAALYTTAHNISNANTPGYTRQRVNFEQVSPFPPAARNRPQIPGQMGAGVQAGSIERVRAEFLDLQFRTENTKAGYYESLSKAMFRMEEVMNEPSEQGLSKTMDRFWQSLQDLSVDSSARSVVLQRGIAVAKTFNYLSSSLTSMQRDLANEITVTSKEINSLSTQLNNINRQISEVEPHGYVPNDLYDERDRLLDQMSQIVNIHVTYTTPSGNPSPLAMGKATVQLAANDGSLSDPPIVLVDGAANEVNKINVNFTQTMGQTVVSDVQVGAQSFSFNDFPASGELAGLITAAGYMGETPTTPAHAVSTAIQTDANGEATLDLGGETLTLAGDSGTAFSVTIANDETLTSLAGKINAADQGVQAEVITQDGVKRLVLSTDSTGKTAALTVESSPAAEALGLTGEYHGANDVNGVYPDMLRNLDIMASAFITQFNQVHTGGESLNTIENGMNEDPPAFFSFGQSYPTDSGIYLNVAGTMKVTDAIKNDTDNIAAANQLVDENGQEVAFAGDGGNAQDLADVRTKSLDLLGEETTVTSFYESMIGAMAVEAQEAKRQESNAKTLRQSVVEQRMSVSAVSLDEEMTNMIKYQHAYNAAARNITVIDEMLDRIINQMGR